MMKHIKNRRKYVLLYGAVKLYFSTLPRLNKGTQIVPCVTLLFWSLLVFRGNENELFICRDCDSLDKKLKTMNMNLFILNLQNTGHQHNASTFPSESKK